MKEPLVSIVLTTLNEEKYIEETLESIAAQRRAPAYEMVVSDGGSSDATIKMAKKYADVIVYEPKRTIGAGRQTGMMASRGQILVCANADSYYPPNWLEELVKPFEKKGVVGSIGKVVPKDGDFIDNAFANGVLHPAAHVLSKVRMHYVDSSNLALGRDAFMRAGGFKTDLISGEDTELVKRMKKFGDIVYSPKALAYISMRRVKKWGKVYYTFFHTTNFIKTHLFHRGHGHYETIRE